MKTVAIVLLCLLAFLVLLFVVPIRIICRIRTAGSIDFSLKLQVLFLRIPILPTKKRLPNLRRFRRGALEKLYAKKQKKAEAAARKKEKKAQKKQNSAKKAAKKGHPTKKRSIRHIIKLVIALAKVLLDRFGRYLRVDIAYLDITAASDDPAKTAILYGWIWAAMENFWNLISDTRMFHRVKKNAISIYADFTAEKPSVSGKITFSIALWQIMAILIAGGAAALAQENEARKSESAKEREERRANEAAARAEMIRELKNK